MGQTYHAIVLLANLMAEDGSLNAESRARADMAAHAFRIGRAPLIVPCGWAYLPGNDLPIAIALRDYLIGAGVPAEAMAPELRSRDTVGDAVFTRMERRYPRLLVVTSDYHAARAGEIFSFVHGRPVAVQPAPAPDGPLDLGPKRAAQERASLLAFRRTFAGIEPGDFQGILRRMLDRHPFYNGDVHPPLEL